MCGINGILRLRPDAPRDRPRRAAAHPRGHGRAAGRTARATGSRRTAGRRSPAAGSPSSTSRRPAPSRWPRRTGGSHIVLNGEIYNFRELRAELEREGRRFRSRSDTEVLLALYARDGAAMLPRLRGMFALAIWDERERRLLLARDPLGIKPLYYSTEGGRSASPRRSRRWRRAAPCSLAVDPAGLAGFLLWGSVPEPLTIRRAVRALPAGHFLDGRSTGVTGRAAAAPPPRLRGRRARRASGAGRGDRRLGARPTWSRTCRSRSSSPPGSTPR